MQVFLSHSEADQELADVISKVLTEEGLRVWDPAREVFDGDNYAEAIGKALNKSRGMVAVLTPEALGTSSVMKDMAFAMGSKAYAHRLVPVLARDPKNRLLDEIPWILKRFPIVRLANKENPREKMREVVKVFKKENRRP
jgi:hypothetical protein